MSFWIFVGFFFRFGSICFIIRGRLNYILVLIVHPNFKQVKTAHFFSKIEDFQGFFDKAGVFIVIAVFKQLLQCGSHAFSADLRQRPDRCGAHIVVIIFFQLIEQRFSSRFELQLAGCLDGFALH